MLSTPSYVTCKTGVCKNMLWDCSILICSYTCIARHTCSPVWQNDVNKKVLHFYVTVCFSWARFCTEDCDHFIWFEKYHFLFWWWRQEVLEKCWYTSSRPYGMKSQNIVIFTVTTTIASDFTKIILLLMFMFHFDSLLCCIK